MMEYDDDDDEEPFYMAVKSGHLNSVTEIGFRPQGTLFLSTEETKKL
jgi:hypothetical protein